MKIILASGSAGRRKLLESLGLKFEVVESNVDEEKIVDADPVKMACKRAEAKAAAVAAEMKKQRDILIISADTVGWLGSWVFNKPKSRNEAEEMLARLSGKTHKYVSAHCILTIKEEVRQTATVTKSVTLSGNVKRPKDVADFRETSFATVAESRVVGYDVSSVTFRKLTKADIDYYLDRVEYLKLCGAFKIMASPQNFVTRTAGSISTIIGLSLEKLIPVLNRFI